MMKMMATKVRGKWNPQIWYSDDEDLVRLMYAATFTYLSVVIKETWVNGVRQVKFAARPTTRCISMMMSLVTRARSYTSTVATWYTYGHATSAFSWFFAEQQCQRKFCTGPQHPHMRDESAFKACAVSVSSNKIHSRYVFINFTYKARWWRP